MAIVPLLCGMCGKNVEQRIDMHSDTWVRCPGCDYPEDKLDEAILEAAQHRLDVVLAGGSADDLPKVGRDPRLERSYRFVFGARP